MEGIKKATNERNLIEGQFPDKDPVPIVYKAGLAPAPVWAGAENFAPSTEFGPRTVQPAASRSLYLLRSPGPSQEQNT
jgi:hypothetical protein